jgi:hypothetical protein
VLHVKATERFNAEDVQAVAKLKRAARNVAVMAE